MPTKNIAIPYLCVHDGQAAIEFYKQAFGATQVLRLDDPANGRVGHAELAIGEAQFYLSDEFPECGARSPKTLGGAGMSIALQVSNVDDLVKQAVAAGAKLERPVEDQFYGERSGHVLDPFGHRWHIATITRQMTQQEMQRRYDDSEAQPTPQK
jgi:PhnB protein